ncbi:MAG TPA: 30S ribosomal protein S16 [Elusimicrobia bacterium]|nr:30S ribosomal protein S16 [Elusimicrobiota bacterium]
MAVVLRLQRIGKRTQPHYRMVAIEKTRGPHGVPIEVIGHYNPKADKVAQKVTVNIEKYEGWIKNGAQASDTVSSLFSKAKKAAKAAVSAPVQK